MSKLSQSQKIVELLKANPNQKFNARQIAEKIVEAYPEDYSEKRLNPRDVLNNSVSRVLRD